MPPGPALGRGYSAEPPIHVTNQRRGATRSPLQPPPSAAQGSRGHGAGGDGGSRRSSETHAVPELPSCALTLRWSGLWHRRPGWGWVAHSSQDPLGWNGGKGKWGKPVLLNRAPVWPGHGPHPCPGEQGWGLPPSRGQAQQQRSQCRHWAKNLRPPAAEPTHHAQRGFIPGTEAQVLPLAFLQVHGTRSSF